MQGRESGDRSRQRAYESLSLLVLAGVLAGCGEASQRIEATSGMTVEAFRLVEEGPESEDDLQGEPIETARAIVADDGLVTLWWTTGACNDRPSFEWRPSGPEGAIVAISRGPSSSDTCDAELRVLGAVFTLDPAPSSVEVTVVE